jgi:predicted DNA-binding protein (MmcQ/YjbR family)
MDIETLRSYCLSKKEVTEGFPFGETTLVFKVKGKIFLLVSLEESPLRFNAKSDPDKALEWREAYESVIPGYHMNKKHWNTVILDGRVPSKQVREMIDDSYTLIVASLPARERQGLL